MKQNLLLFLALMASAIFSVQADNSCGADTTFFYLPQNEFNTSNGWYFAPANSEDAWQGSYNLYEMYDPCVALNNTVIISEVNQQASYGAYIELTNVGDQPVDLSSYRLIAQRNSYPTAKVQRMCHINLSGILQPGECYLVMAYNYYSNEQKSVMDWADSIPSHNVLLESLGDFKVPNDKRSSVYKDVVGRTYDLFEDTWLNNFFLAKLPTDTTEVIVDVVGTSYVEDGRATIAGVPGAQATNTLVRKHFTGGRTYGNPDFKIGAGAEAAEASEWIVIPRFRRGTSHLPTTIGSHNPGSVFSVGVKEGSGAVIDESKETIYLPKTSYKGDSVLSFLTVGADMAWEYTTNGVAEDNQSNLIHVGDTITFYHCGVDVTVKSYRIDTLASSGKTAVALSLNRSSDLARMYYETSGLEVDTIYGSRLYYDYPVDTLLKYVEITDGATAEMVWADEDEARPTLKDGDKLRVTSKDGSVTHDYYIALIPYEHNILSHDARLSAITWPDYPSNDLDPYLWNIGDTIPGFNKDAFTYIVTLPAGTEDIPAIQAFTNSSRASLRSYPATNLYAGEEAQTSTFVVTAEDDSTIMSYSVRFIVETEDYDYEGEPFFSEISYNTGYSLNFEICNPGNVLLDLSDYVIAVGRKGSKTLSTLLQWQTKAFDRNVHIYRPGYVYDSLTMATNQQYWFDPNGDANVDPLVEPGGTFTIASTRADGSTWGYADVNTGLWASGSENGIIDGPNVILHGSSSTREWDYNKYGGSPYDLIGRVTGTYYRENTFFLLRILNDSIKDGSKGAANADDYEIVDVVGKIENGQTIGWADPATGVPFFPVSDRGVLMRKPAIYKGNPASMSSFGYDGVETPSDYDAANPVLGDSAAFEWTYQTNASPANYDMGRHTLAPVTVYKSTIQSETYSVTLGLSMEEDIYGVSENTTVADFMTNIIKLHEGQELLVTTSEGSYMFDFDVINEGCLLKVTSADKANTSQYAIHVGVLSADVSLASAEYEVSGAEVKLTGLATSVSEMLGNLTINENSKMYVVDSKGGLIALRAYDLGDSLYYDAMVTGDMAVKVVAQTGATKLYDIVLPADASSAYVTSYLYKVDQDNKLINGVKNGINTEMLLNSLVPCEGATMTLVNKWAQEKEFGLVLFNDVVKVVSADGTNTVYYGVTLDTEDEPEVILDVADVVVDLDTKVYPNPTSGVLNFNEAVVKATVYDITGKELMDIEAEVMAIDISGLKPGVYILSAKNKDGGSFTVKVTKQ